MTNHEQIWKAIETIAKMNGYSPSGLAKKAGLDPTTFNKSKRESANGRLRWPTTESINKVLEVTNTSMGQFALIMQNSVNESEALFLNQVNLSELKQSQSPPSDSDDLKFNTMITAKTKSILVDSADYEPHINKGDSIIINISNNIHVNDIILLALKNNDMAIGKLIKKSVYKFEIKSFHKDHKNGDSVILNNNVNWLGHVIWKSM